MNEDMMLDSIGCISNVVHINREFKKGAKKFSATSSDHSHHYPVKGSNPTNTIKICFKMKMKARRRINGILRMW